MDFMQLLGLAGAAILAAFLREWIWPGSVIEGRERNREGAAEHPADAAAAQNLLTHRPDSGIPRD
jgi:hypothetical protein